MRLRVSRKAREDLLDIAHFTVERWGEEQARKYLWLLDSKLRALARHPTAGIRSDDIRPGYWRVREGRHVIFYRVGAKTLDVIRILHERMLPERHL